MADPDADRELNEVACALATAILNAGSLKGAERTSVGVELERELKRFARLLLQRAGEPQSSG